MTIGELSKRLSFECVHEGHDREVRGVYCCDLLSVVMGRAGADEAWVTVMGNVNAVAVALLADVACIIVAEGMPVDSDALLRARQNDIPVYKTDKPIFETALAVSKLL